MKNIILKTLLLFLYTLPILKQGYCQLPDPTFFYHHQGTTIYNYNTITTANTVNTISLPSGASGFAVNNNFFSGPAMTYYTTVGGNFYYYNGSSWVNTGHYRGHTSAVNIGGAGPFIFNLNGSGKQVYRYDGTGAATFLMNLPATWGGPWDCSGDASGNFYIMRSNVSPGNVTQYDSNGNVVQVYSLIGFPTSFAGGGFAFIGGRIYTTIGSTRCWGTISGTTITYGGPLTLIGGTSDYANWPLPINPLPVELVTFTGVHNEETSSNELTWTTSSETNNSHFIIEYSNNALDWEYLTRVEGNGNSNSDITYPIVYHNPTSSVTYYRLIQYDFDNNHETLQTIAVHGSNATSYTQALDFDVFPNPASDFIMVNTKKGHPEFDYEVTDQMGNTILINKIKQKNHTIDVKTLTPGLYYINIITQSGKEVFKFIKS